MRPRCPSVGPEGYRCLRREHGAVPGDPTLPDSACHRAQGQFWDDETALEPVFLQEVSMGDQEVVWDVALLVEQCKAAEVTDVRVDHLVDPSMVNRSDSYWRTVDIHTPIIMAPHPETGRPVTLDGRHRLYKAWKQGRQTIKAYVLTEAQERAARI